MAPSPSRPGCGRRGWSRPSTPSWEPMRRSWRRYGAPAARAQGAEAVEGPGAAQLVDAQGAAHHVACDDAADGHAPYGHAPLAAAADRALVQAEHVAPALADHPHVAEGVGGLGDALSERLVTEHRDHGH